MVTSPITPEGFKRLSDELKHRKNVERHEISRAIETAREHGDLKENAEYHAAKDEQGMNEDRIRVLESRLRNAVISEVDPNSGEVAVGMIVTVDDDGDVEEYFIGSMEDTPGEGVEVVSASSPMGKALLGSKTGDAVSYTGPTGVTFTMTITDVRAP